MTDPDGMRKFGIRPFSSGMFACPCKALCPSTVLGSPMNVLTSGVPKPSLKPQSTQTIRTSPKVVNTISTVFIAHFFWTRPPYRTARAGIDISPTSVAAVICQELSPALSQLGYGFTMPPGGNGAFWGPTCWLAPPRPLRIPARHVSHARVSGVFLGCYAAGNECGGRYLEMSPMIAWSAASTGRAPAGAAQQADPRGQPAARNPRQHRRSGSCHVHVTVVILTLEIICPIVVVCWHTGLV